MSQENVEIVRKSLEALNPDLDAVAEFWHPEIDGGRSRARPMTSASSRATLQCGTTTSNGSRPSPSFGRRSRTSWMPVSRFVALHVMGKVEGSQAEIDMRLGIVCTVRDRSIVRGREYATREDALEAAGLRE